MVTVLLSDECDRWLSALQDRRAQARISARLRAAELGHFGDTAPVGDGVFELRIHDGPGYRMYYVRRGEEVYLLLIGGDKSTQKRDIKKAKAMATMLRKDGR